MELIKRSAHLEFYLVLLLLNGFLPCMTMGDTRFIKWVIKETKYTRLCSSKKILTVNGMFPGPTLHAHTGETVIVNIQNDGNYNVTIHWHGVKQPRNPWSDGPEYVTQCPIKPGANFSYEIVLSDEEGTLWWHAHSDWSRATIHGPIIIFPQNGTGYPFPKPHAEFPIVLASWYKGDVNEVIENALESGGETNTSNAYTINGQPGDLYPCSKQGTFKLKVDYGKTYLLRVINAIMNEEMFFMVANHTLTVVGMDGAYTKPLVTNYIMITPGQTMDILITANQIPSHYYMASRAYAGVVYDNTTTTAIFKYTGNYTAPSIPSFPNLPDFTDHQAAENFTNKIKALATDEHPINVPLSIDTRLIITVSMNVLPCGNNNTCNGPRGGRLAASLNNVSYEMPSIDILQAYYRNINNVYETDFPSRPPFVFNYTSTNLTSSVWLPDTGTKVRVIEYGSNVEIVFQGTNVLSSSENHPLHLHGYSFYAVGYGTGNFNETQPHQYNLVDPPLVNTIGVPFQGWAAIRFKADNPGVWFMHCHLERHSSWGMDAVLIVKNGSTLETSMRGPPSYLNPC